MCLNSILDVFKMRWKLIRIIGMDSTRRINNWLGERAANTGDMLYFRSPRYKEVQHGIVIRTGLDQYEVMPFGRCYFEDMIDAIPVRLLGVHMPSVEMLESCDVIPVAAEVKQSTLEKKVTHPIPLTRAK